MGEVITSLLYYWLNARCAKITKSLFHQDTILLARPIFGIETSLLFEISAELVYFIMISAINNFDS